MNRGMCVMEPGQEQKKQEQPKIVRPSHRNQGTEAFRPDKQKEEESNEQKEETSS